MQTEGIYKTLIVSEDIITPPDNLPENPSDEQLAARDAQQRQYTTKVEQKENRNNTVWCYLAMTLDSTTLMTIHHDCVNADGISNGEAACKCALDRFRSNEAPIVVSIGSEVARLKMSEGERIQNFIIRDQDLYSRLQQAGEHLSAVNFNVLILTRLLEQYDHSIVQG